MADLELQQTPQRAVEASRAPRWHRYRGGMIAAALAVMGGLWIVMPPRGDTALSAAEQAQRLAAFEAVGTLSPTVVGPQERLTAVAGMQLPAPAQTALEGDLNARKTELVWLTLWDDRDEDGDTVLVESNGFTQQVRLANKPIRIAVPRPAQGVINVRGVYDGGGGITVAITVGNQTLAMPVMAVGQVLGIPVR